MPRTWIVVPCFNEAARLRADAYVEFAGSQEDAHLLFVDDGSSDDTVGVLRGLVDRLPERIDLLELRPNRGKAEAVRAGLNEAWKRGAEYAGYWDADLATPLDELPAFVELLDRNPHLEMVFGSRVALLGHSIERRALRHYLGRVFATAVSLALELTVYDTQCGAKLFRGSPACRALFAEPFTTRWVFDVEIIARFIRAAREHGQRGAAEVIVELPLQRWTDVPGSKVRPWDFVLALRDVMRIRRLYLRDPAPPAR